MRKQRRTVAFVGNCQAQTLAALYRRRVAALLGEDVIWVQAPLRNPNEDLPKALATLAKADIVVDQRFDSADVIPATFFAGRKTRWIRFPHLAGRFYWPYTGANHPHLPQGPEAQPFPYVAELGDSLLNQMILESVPTAEVLSRYDAAVAGGRGRFARLAELHLERQRDRDRVCDMHFADHIAANYQSEALFSSQGHPTLPLLRMLVERLFAAIEVPYSLIDAALRSLRVTPFPMSELPIHTGVADALGLRFVTPEQRYRFQHEGAFTFAEFALRYHASAWEPDLERAMVRFHAGETEPAVDLLQAVLQRCEGSGTVWRTLASGLSQLGRQAAAVEAINVAIVRDPASPDPYETLAQIMLRQRDYPAAEAAARRAIELFPQGVVGHRALARVLSQQGRHTAAVAVARMVVANDLGDAKGLLMLGHHLQLAGELRESEWVLRRAHQIEPGDSAIKRKYEDIQARLRRASEKAA